MRIGDEFEGRYTIVRQLGAGGYATVWLAEHQKIGQKVAIKLTHEPGSDPRFLREAKIMATLKNPHTVRILDFGETDEGHAYIISEFVEGQSLLEVQLRGALPPDEVIAILEQVLASLSEAHEHGIIHRDIKPANLMRTPDGTIKLLDFGIARVPEAIDVQGLTASGVVLGTPRYLAPEVMLQPESVTPSADVFALGLVALGLLTGREANAGLSSREIVARTLNGEPFALPADLDVPPLLSRWISVATSKHINDRYPNATVALRALQADETTQLWPAPGPSPGPAPAVSNHGEGLRELELELGDDPAPMVADVVRKLPEIEVSEALPARPVRPRERALWPYAVLGLLVIIGASVATAVKLGYLSLEPERPQLSPVPDDPRHVIETYQQGKTAFNEGRWQEALMHFQNVEQAPDTNSARDLIAKDYVGRIISDVLEDAVDKREQAKTDQEFAAAAEGPRELLKFFPEHEATRYVLRSIEAAGNGVDTAKPHTKGRTKKRRERKKPSIKIEGIN